MKSVTMLVAAVFCLGAATGGLAEDFKPKVLAANAGLATIPTSTVGTGKAKLCALDDVKFDTYKQISIPATSVFKDWGTISASKDDPDHWAIPHADPPTGEYLQSAFVTMDAVTSQQGPSLRGDEGQNAHCLTRERILKLRRSIIFSPWTTSSTTQSRQSGRQSK